MKLLGECYACAMRQALSAARLVTDDERFHIRCLAEAARILSGTSPEVTPPEVGEEIYRAVRVFSGNPDPFREQKKRQNEVVNALLPWLRETVESARDPLLMAVRLAIAGNAVDPGAQESFDLEASVMEAVAQEASLEAYPALGERVRAARTALVVADNCGEIVFDRVLVETLAGAGTEVVVAVRGGPIINDVTEVEALQVGMDEVSRVVSSGMEMPGTVVERATGEFREVFSGADLVISKGQGNWETLEDSEREVFFLFQAKCPAVAAVNRCLLGEALLLRSPAGD